MPRIAPILVEFDWAPLGTTVFRYRARLEADGELAIEAERRPVRLWGRWDHATATITIERVQWTPSKDHPVVLDIASLARATALAIQQKLARRP